MTINVPVALFTFVFSTLASTFQDLCKREFQHHVVIKQRAREGLLCIDGIDTCLDGSETCLDGSGIYLDGSEICLYSRDSSDICLHNGKLLVDLGDIVITT